MDDNQADIGGSELPSIHYPPEITLAAMCKTEKINFEKVAFLSWQQLNLSVWTAHNAMDLLVLELQDAKYSAHAVSKLHPLYNIKIYFVLFSFGLFGRKKNKIPCLQLKRNFCLGFLCWHLHIPTQLILWGWRKKKRLESSTSLSYFFPSFYIFFQNVLWCRDIQRHFWWRTSAKIKQKNGAASKFKQKQIN